MPIMETVEAKKPRPRRCSPASLRQTSWRAAIAATATIRQIAPDFDLTETAVREWVRHAEVDAGGGTASAPRSAGSSPVCDERLLSHRGVGIPPWSLQTLWSADGAERGPAGSHGGARYAF